MKSLTQLLIALALLFPLTTALVSCDSSKDSEQTFTGRTFIEFEIHQSLELIGRTHFNEPSTFAIWLENPDTHKTQTVFVTYRAASGDWVGKAECPGCLPLWFEIFQTEFDSIEPPTSDFPAPEAITGPTPTQELFKTSVEVKPSSKWICWLEVNLAGDFNQKFKEYDEDAKTVDWDLSGQPPLVYRAEITATPGTEITPELFGYVVTDVPFEQMIQPVTDDITTARNVFKSIKIRVVQTPQ